MAVTVYDASLSPSDFTDLAATFIFGAAGLAIARAWPGNGLAMLKENTQCHSKIWA